MLDVASVQLIPVEIIERKIYLIRGCQVMLDSDLAELYQVQTKRLNEAVRRNLRRFPADFMFQLNEEELENLRSQIATSNSGHGDSGRPYAFTEHGVAMLSSVLTSERAVELNILIIRAFVHFASTSPPTKTWPENWKMSNALSMSTVRTLNRFMAISNSLMEPAPDSSKRRIGFQRRRNEFTCRSTPDSSNVRFI